MKNTSQKGKKKTVGAPEKTVKYPRGSFTISDVAALNPEVCELTIRMRVKKNLASRILKKGETIPQPNGAVGRPQTTFTVNPPKDKQVNPVKSRTVSVVNVDSHDPIVPTLKVVSPVAETVTQ